MSRKASPAVVSGLTHLRLTQMLLHQTTQNRPRSVPLSSPGRWKKPEILPISGLLARQACDLHARYLSKLIELSGRARRPDISYSLLLSIDRTFTFFSRVVVICAKLTSVNLHFHNGIKPTFPLKKKHFFVSSIIKFKWQSRVTRMDSRKLNVELVA